MGLFAEGGGGEFVIPWGLKRGVLFCGAYAYTSTYSDYPPPPPGVDLTFCSNIT